MNRMDAVTSPWGNWTTHIPPRFLDPKTAGGELCFSIAPQLYKEGNRSMFSPGSFRRRLSSDGQYLLCIELTNHQTSQWGDLGADRLRLTPVDQARRLLPSLAKG